MIVARFNGPLTENKNKATLGGFIFKLIFEIPTIVDDSVSTREHIFYFSLFRIILLAQQFQ